MVTHAAGITWAKLSVGPTFRGAYLFCVMQAWSSTFFFLLSRFRLLYRAFPCGSPPLRKRYLVFLSRLRLLPPPLVESAVQRFYPLSNSWRSVGAQPDKILSCDTAGSLMWRICRLFLTIVLYILHQYVSPIRAGYFPATYHLT